MAICSHGSKAARTHSSRRFRSQTAHWDCPEHTRAPLCACAREPVAVPDAVPQLKLPLKGQAGSTDLLLMEFSRLLDLKIPEAGNLSTIQHANWVHDNTMPSATGTPVSRRARVFLPCLTTRAQKGVLWPQQSDSCWTLTKCQVLLALL